MEYLINIKDVCKVYYNTSSNKLYALNKINLKVCKGEYVSIVGKSGSGKSTLMNILGCLDSPTSGEYFLNGQLVSGMNDRKLSEIRNMEIGFIFQSFNLISTLTALENVELPLIYRGMAKYKRNQIARNALISVGLGSRMNHKPSQMSGGQQQRVAIARAIAVNPPIILADEPTGNLDSKSSEDIIDILKDLNNNGKTIILITHDTQIAKEAFRIVNINDGKIISDMEIDNKIVS